MTLKEEWKWEGQLEARLKTVHETEAVVAAGKAQKVTYYWFVGEASSYATEAYLEGDPAEAIQAVRRVVKAAMEYFYGDWRNRLATEEGETGFDAWRQTCLWYDEVMESLPFATALSDWDAVKRIAAYPPENKLPEPARAKGETAWGWALICFLRGDPRERVEEFIGRVMPDKAKRPKLLCSVLQGLLDNDAGKVQKHLETYLEFFRQREFRRVINKLLSSDGTVLYHLARKLGMKITLTEPLADYIIRLD